MIDNYLRKCTLQLSVNTESLNDTATVAPDKQFDQN